MANKIEEAVCSFYGCNVEDIYSNSKTKKVSNSRSMIWYMLHYDLMWSISQIAKQYNRTERNIKYAVSKTKFFVQESFAGSREYILIKGKLWSVG